MNYVRVGGYIPPQPIEDYNDLPNIPVINQDLTVSGFTPVANTYYRHTGATTDTFTQGVIYLYNGTGYAALDGAAVNNGTLTIQKNGTNVATFGANQISSVTANITVPTKASDIDALPISGGTITGNLTVGGNLTVNGTTTTVDSTTLQVKDKLIEVAHGNTTTLTTPAGLVAPKYDGTNSGALVFDSTGTAYVGDVTLKDGNIDVANSGLQPLATRTGLVGGNLVQYDSSALTLKDSGKKISDFATSVKVNDNTIAPSGGVVDIGTVLTDASAFATSAQGSNADSALIKANANATEISNIKNGTTKVKSAEHADTADSATSAGTADKVANGLTLGGGVVYDGSKALSITAGNKMSITGGPGGVSIGLVHSVMPSTYNKVTVDGYGTVTAGENVDYLTSHQAIKKLNTNNTTAQDANASEAIAGSGTINLHKVAKTGSYNDLLYKPTIPAAANNGTLTIQKNGTTVQTFTANQSSSVTANITVPTKVSELTNDSGYTTNKGTVTSVSVKMNGASKGTVTSSGTIDLGTVLTDASKFATAAQGTKADNAMPKSGGTFTGNISLPKELIFTDNTNPFIKMTTGGTDFYFQSTSGQFGLGPTWNKATHWDSNGNVTFPTTPKVGSSPLALKSDIPSVPTDYVKYTAQTLTDAQKSQARSNIGAGTSNFSGNYNDLSNKPTIPTFTLSGTTLTITTN